MNIDNFNLRKLSPFTKNPEAILGVNEERVYWYTREKKDYGVSSGDYNVVWWTSIDGSDQGKLETNEVEVVYFAGGIAFSLDGKMVAWRQKVPEPECDTKEKRNALYASGDYASTCLMLYAAQLSDMNHPIKIPLVPQQGNIPDDFESNPFIYDLTWSSNNSDLFILNPGSRGAYNTINMARMFYVDFKRSKPEFTWLEEFPSVKDYKESAWNPTITSFSPDGRQIFINKITSENEYEYIRVDLESMDILEEIPSGLNHDEVYNMHLLP